MGVLVLLGVFDAVYPFDGLGLRERENLGLLVPVPVADLDLVLDFDLLGVRVGEPVLQCVHARGDAESSH